MSRPAHLLWLGWTPSGAVEILKFADRVRFMGVKFSPEFSIVFQRNSPGLVDFAVMLLNYRLH